MTCQRFLVQRLRLICHAWGNWEHVAWIQELSRWRGLLRWQDCLHGLYFWFVSKYFTWPKKSFTWVKIKTCKLQSNIITNFFNKYGGNMAPLSNWSFFTVWETNFKSCLGLFNKAIEHTLCQKTYGFVRVSTNIC